MELVCMIVLPFLLFITGFLVGRMQKPPIFGKLLVDDTNKDHYDIQLAVEDMTKFELLIHKRIVGLEVVITGDLSRK